MITFRLVLWRELWRESAASACVIGWNVQEQFNETCINTSPNFIEKWKRRASDRHNFPLVILWKILRRTQFQSRLREVWKSERVVLICLCLRGFVSLCVRAVSVVSVRLCCLRDCYLQCKSWSAMYGSWKHAQERILAVSQRPSLHLSTIELWCCLHNVQNRIENLIIRIVRWRSHTSSFSHVMKCWKQLFWIGIINPFVIPVYAILVWGKYAHHWFSTKGLLMMDTEGTDEQKKLNTRWYVGFLGSL